MNYNTSIENENGSITFHVLNYGGWGRINNPNEMATAMSTGDFLDIFAACEGNFLRLEENTRKAMVIKGKELNGNYKEQAERRKEYRKMRSERRHNGILAEVRELMEGKDSFTSFDVQMTAVKRGNGFPVRTRQMYTYHLNEELGKTTAYAGSGTARYINVILSNGRKGTQRIPGNNRFAYKFVE